MKNIEMLARKFRKAIDMACEENRFANMIPFNHFPKDCCRHTCDLLSQYLLEHDIRTNIVKGVCSKDSQWNHLWLETENGIVIDITGDQFIGRLVTETEVKAVHVGGEGTVHKIFCKNRELERVERFTDKKEYTGFGGAPSVYQQRLVEVYDILRSYL